MLNGIFTYNVDQKGRIVMPNRFLEEIGNPFVLAGHPNGYLVAASSPDAIQDRNAVRGYVECQIKDRTGRFVIPSALRQYAELVGNGEATVVGVGDEVEIWNKRRWDSVARLGSNPARPAVADPLSDGAAPRRAATGFAARPGAPGSDAGRLAQPSPAFSAGAPASGFAPGQEFRAPRPRAAAPGEFQHHYTPRSHQAPERVGVQQKAIYGQPYIEVDGALGYAETDKVLTRLDTALRGRPRTLFLDLRRVDTVDAGFLMALEPSTYQLASTGGRLAILTERQDVAALIHRLFSPAHTRVFPDLESALWWLVDEGHA